jgi:hypothetical protein
VAIATIIQNFILTPDSRTQYPIKFDPKNPALTPIGGSHVKVTKIE